MKINLKDYEIPKIVKISENEAFYEEAVDPLEKEWNMLHLQTLEEDKYENINNDIKASKVEIETLNTTLDLISKGVIKQYEVKDSVDDSYNINIIRPCIEYLEKGIQILKNKTEKKEKTKTVRILIKYKNVTYIEERILVESFKEQNVITKEYTIQILNLDNTENISEHKQSTEYPVDLFLKRLVDFLVENDVEVLQNLSYINLYISKIYTMIYRDNKYPVLNYGNILADGYSEKVFVICGKDIYKIIRSELDFQVYKNEERMLS